jgi:rRNA maturation RNase YbeY
MINVQIETDPELNGLDDNKSVEILKCTLQSEGVESGDISIIFGNKKLLQELKNQFFYIDHTTDVIAFRLNKYEEKNVDGEIYICLPVAKENAEYFDEPYEKEIARLIIHGGQRQEMKNLEENYLKELKY